MAPLVIGSQKPEARDNTSALEQKIGMATSVIMPLLEFGAIGFVTWVLCYLICIQYLINPSPDLRNSFAIQPRRSTGIALIVVYAILLLVLLIPWMRLLQVIWTKSDILRRDEPTKEKVDADSTSIEQYDAYICDYDGTPLFCDKCRIFKPDRVHHCKEIRSLCQKDGPLLSMGWRHCCGAFAQILHAIRLLRSVVHDIRLGRSRRLFGRTQLQGKFQEKAT
ncbi:hypothetical protein SNOG_02863 [Parastagonospora nodorum SN15]|uniref:Protein S-acyltransferase n=1 Tax=Phaeosphaeria nodorum (strain SN15 / ATCC MYA-4574 / FGSC 10173) TaxID=321614 RepID=Q0UZF1_PHANO|nr:hypothetical protein SNOG_02863 [Parastagonospora nodorum SN15]EAT89594.2 hypothetical protein SNOG_02863 [Parastagonospora nodorum SN15]